MRASGQLVVGRCAGVKVYDSAIRRHREREVVIFGSDVHRHAVVRVVLNCDTVSPELVGVDERVVQHIAHPDGFVKNQDVS